MYNGAKKRMNDIVCTIIVVSEAKQWEIGNKVQKCCIQCKSCQHTLRIIYCTSESLNSENVYWQILSRCRLSVSTLVSLYSFIYFGVVSFCLASSLLVISSASCECSRDCDIWPRCNNNWLIERWTLASVDGLQYGREL